ncbi:MAG: TetR/AcrR family transcriptional regulator [Candidatus Dormiibacterota bacterium]
MPEQAKPQPMRERIVAAAVRVMAAHGVTNTTTREIAREAGVSEGSLYNHFENKTALFGAAFGRVASGIRASMQELFSSVGRGTLAGNLATFAADAIRFYDELLPITGSVLGDRELLAWLQRTGRAGGLGQGHAGLVRYLEAEQERGRLSGGAQPPFIAAGLLGACQHRAFATLLGGPAGLAVAPGLDTEVDEYARRLVDTLLTSQLP